MNADAVILLVKCTTTGAKTTSLVLYPAEDTDTIVNVKAISDDTTAPGNLELDYDGTGYNKTNSTIGTTTTNTDMVGTDSAALATGVQLSAQGKLDVNAECDTSLTDYGANTTTPPTVTAIRTEIDSNSTRLAAIEARPKRSNLRRRDHAQPCLVRRHRVRRGYPLWQDHPRTGPGTHQHSPPQVPPRPDPRRARASLHPLAGRTEDRSRSGLRARGAPSNTRTCT